MYDNSNASFASLHTKAVFVWSPRLNSKPMSYVLVPLNALFNTINGSFTNVFVEATVM